MRRLSTLVGTATVVAVCAGAAPTTLAGQSYSLRPASQASPVAYSPAGADDGWPQGASRARPTVQLGGVTYPAPNPYLALLPATAGVDWEYWQRWAGRMSWAAGTEAGDARAEPVLVHEEHEPADLLGANDRRATAESLDGFGTGAGENSAVMVLGSLALERVRAQRVEPSREDDGSIPKARETGLGRRLEGLRTTGVIGDGPHGERGSGSGDFDYFRVDVPRGRQVVARMSARGDGSRLQPLLAVWGAKGALKDVAFPRGNSLSLTSPLAAGTYYVMASGCCPYPESRFRSGSGTGAESEGAYNLSIAVNRPDRDYYAFDLDQGDVLGGTVAGAGTLSVYAPGGTLVFQSGQDASFIYPANTSLPGGGEAVVDHVAATSGRYTVAVEYGTGSYRMDLEAYRAGLEQEPAGSVQTLFLDFDGERLNTSIFGGPGVRELSPLSSFLGRWRLPSRRENAVIDEVVAVVTENLQTDLAAHGLGDVRIRVLNSRDHADPWGEPHVSRVVVGGSVRESGVPTIGIAQSIDPGNMVHEETALLLLDLLSGPAEDDFSINHYLTRDSKRVAFVGQVLGNLVAHEAGHFFGNWHVDQFDHRPNLMDQGGNAPAIFGPGPDGVGGTADDRDVDFGVNRLNPFEGFAGFEDTAARTGLGLLAGQQ